MSDGPLAQLALSGSTGALDIKGTCGAGEVARSGTWASAASCTGGLTTFAIESWADICEEQEGWWLQPDINTQAWFPITHARRRSSSLQMKLEAENLPPIKSKNAIFPHLGTGGLCR